MGKNGLTVELNLRVRIITVKAVEKEQDSPKLRVKELGPSPVSSFRQVQWLLTLVVFFEPCFPSP